MQNVQQQQPAQEQSPQQKEVEKWSKKMQATWKKRDEFYQNFGIFKSDWEGMVDEAVDEPFL
jgi:hypothetical protein